MVRVVLICGSLQRASTNQAALDVAGTALSSRGVEVSAFDGLGAIPPLNPDRVDEPGDAVLALRTQIGTADAVLIAAPEYAGAIAGVVKNALDWIVGSGDLYGKPVAILSAGTSGGVFARRDLVRTLSWQGAHVVASVGIEGANAKSVTDSDGSRRFAHAPTLAAIGALASSLVASVAQRPSERFAAITRLARDAGVELGPVAEHIAAQDEAWLPTLTFAARGAIDVTAFSLQAGRRHGSSLRLLLRAAKMLSATARSSVPHACPVTSRYLAAASSSVIGHSRSKKRSFRSA